MLGLEDYGSDSDTEPTSQPGPSQPASSSSNNKSNFAFPLPSNGNVTKTLSSQQPKAKSKRTVFTVAKPSKESSDNDDNEHERVVKKPRLSPRGAGSSSLLAMLPAPSKVVVAPAKALGAAAQGSGTGLTMPLPHGPVVNVEPIGFSARKAEETDIKSTNLLPPSLTKAKHRPTPNDSGATEPSTDFFSLGESSSRRATSISNHNNSTISISSAPTIPNFEPPVPMPSDPHPGYYRLPSGAWAAYEPEFYKKHYDSWYNSQGSDVTTQKGFEGAEDNTVEIDAQEQLDRARKEREEKKMLTANAGRGPETPNMNIKRPKIGSLARTRHQLSSLLTDAYENREALEEKIAQGRRNRKEAGNKYGF